METAAETAGATAMGQPLIGGQSAAGWLYEKYAEKLVVDVANKYYEFVMSATQ